MSLNREDIGFLRGDGNMRKWCAEDGRTVLWTLIGIGIGVIAGALDFLFASGLQLCTQLRTAHLWLLAPFLGLAGSAHRDALPPLWPAGEAGHGAGVRSGAGR